MKQNLFMYTGSTLQKISGIKISFLFSSGKDQEELNFVEKKSAYGITYIFCCFYLKLALKKEKNQDMLLVI